MKKVVSIVKTKKRFVNNSGVFRRHAAYTAFKLPEKCERQSEKTW